MSEVEYIETPKGIGDLMPRLMHLRKRVNDSMRREPDAIMLPKALDPDPYEGEDATDIPAHLMGLPVVWSDEGHVGIILLA